MQGLVDSYVEDCNPFVDVDKQRHSDKAQLIDKLDALPSTPTRADLDALPDVVQLNAGETALQYSPCAREGSKILAPLGYSFAWDSPDAGVDSDVTASGNKLADGAVRYQRWPKPLGLEMRGQEKGYDDDIYEDQARWLRPYLSCDSEGVRDFWMAPIAIHHLNRLYFNVAAAQRLKWPPRTQKSPPLIQLEAPKPDGEIIANIEDISGRLGSLDLTGWLELLSYNPGQTIFALPNGTGSGWALNLLAAENIRVARNLELQQPPMAMNEQVAIDVMRAMTTIRAVSQPDGIVWSVGDAMGAVKRGDAVFTVMGDWSYPDVADAGVQMIPFPGTQHALVYTIDGFVGVNQNQVDGPTGATKQARAWLRTVDDETVASEFAKTKGAVSIKDWLKRKVPECAETAYDDYDAQDERDNVKRKDCWVVPAMSMRGQNCDAATELLDWVREPKDSKYLEAQVRLAECMLGASAE